MRISSLFLAGGLTLASVTATADLPDKDKLGALRSALQTKMGEYKLLQNRAGRCLDAPPDTANNNGGRVILWDCHNGNFQRWKYENGKLINSSGKCLDVVAPELHKNGGHVQLWDCNGGPTQQWQFENGRLRSAGGKCLDIPAPNPNWNVNGASLQIWDCLNSDNQKFEHKVWWGK